MQICGTLTAHQHKRGQTMKHLGKTDSVTTCDCCGKSGLKVTYAAELDCGEIAHYGSTCVAKHTGQKAAVIDKAMEDAAAAVKATKTKAYEQSAEYLQLAAKMAQAHKLGLIGVAFKQFCNIERQIAETKRAEIFA